MKIRILMLWILLVSLGGASFAFEPNTEEIAELWTLKTQITHLTENDQQTLRSLYQQARDLHPHFKQEKTAYYLEHLRDFLLNKLQTRKELAKNEGKELKSDFLTQYQDSGLMIADPLSEHCIGRYQTLDNLSFAYNFPTALTIAVWRKESSCGYYLPKNGDGPFQIVSKDYGNWTITRAIFEKTIQDFLEFSKRKIQRYNEKNPNTPILLNYNTFNYRDLLKFTGLYNGLSGGTVYGEIGPAAPRYFFEKTPWEFENGKRNGLFAQFLRVIERELNQ